MTMCSMPAVPLSPAASGTAASGTRSGLRTGMGGTLQHAAASPFQSAVQKVQRLQSSAAELQRQALGPKAARRHAKAEEKRSMNMSTTVQSSRESSIWSPANWYFLLLEMKWLRLIGAVLLVYVSAIALCLVVRIPIVLSQTLLTALRIMSIM